jgi:outer membrane murein-binding lipoprotein Lpp
MLYDLENRDATIRSLAAIDTFTESSRRLAVAVDRLPADVESLVGGSQAALAEANRALQTAQQMVGPLQTTAEQLNLASSAWGAILVRDGEPDPDARPVDIREYEATARQIGEAAAELRALTEQLGQLGDSPALEAAFGGVDSAVARAQTGGRSLVDHAAWRGAQLLLVLFGLMLAYRIISSRLAPRAH